MIEVNRLGATLLNQGSNADHSSTIHANIVFVHGLRGHPRRTWEAKKVMSKESKGMGMKKGKGKLKDKFLSSISLRSKRPNSPVPEGGNSVAEEDEENENTSTFWPADLLPLAIPSARIWTYGYNADVIGLFSANNKNSILQHGNDLMVKLERALGSNTEPIIFVAHSLGGLVVKDAIHRWNSSLDQRYRKFVSRVYAVIFCGTPHRGSNAAPWGLLASNIVAAAAFDSSTRLLSDLKVDSQILDLIQENFLKVLHPGKIKVHSFLEGRGLTGVHNFSGKVVNDFSAKVGYALETSETIDADHRHMVKAVDERSPVFGDISGVLVGYVQEISSSKASEQNPPEPYTYLDRFFVFDYHSIIQKIPKRYENTCEWLFEHNAFKSWYSSDETITLWVYGYPGQGKSVIAKFIAQILTDEESPLKTQKLPNFLQRSTGFPLVVAHFFCSHDIDDATSVRTVLCSLIHQLLFQHPEFSKGIESKWKVIDETVTKSIWNLWKALSLIISSDDSVRIFFIIDAVDELQEQFWEDFLDEFRKHILAEKFHVHIFITSRKEPAIENKIMEWKPLRISLDDSPRAKDDVNTFVRGSVETYAKTNKFDESSTETIKREIVSRSAGMFLWATLAWYHFTDGVGLWTSAILAQRIAQLKRLPPGLDALYHRIMMTIDKRLHTEVLDVLRWIAFVKRPLSIDELSIALAMRDKPTNSGEIDVRSSVQEFLKRRLPYLVEVDQYQIRIVHQSFREFLTECQEVSIDDLSVPNKFFLDGRTVEWKLCTDCLAYIALNDFIIMQQAIDEIRSYGIHHVVGIHIPRVYLSKFLFLDYSTTHWPAHAISGAGSHDGIDAIWTAFKRIIDRPSHYKIMCAGYGISGYFNPPIFVAFRLGLDFLVDKMVSEGHDINEIDEGNMHIIHSHPRANRRLRNDYSPSESLSLPDDDIDFLLGLGADINGRDCYGQTILIRLVKTIGRHCSLERIKSWLRRSGVDINAQDRDGRTVLHAAVNALQAYIDPLLDILLAEESLDVNAQDSLGRPALTITTHWGDQKTMQKLLQCPRIDISRALYQGESLLINVARQGWNEILISLLERLPSVDDFRDPDNRTILHWTVIMAMPSALQIAITKQSQIVNLADHLGMTALHYAVQEGDFNATVLLLKNGASPGLKTKLNESVLHLAALKGHKKILEHLLKLVPAYVLNERDFMGYTALHKSVVSGNEGLVKYLASLSFADWTKRDRHGKTPLMFAAAFGSIETFQTVFSKSKVQLDHFGNTLLHHAVGAENLAVICYLLKNESSFSCGTDRQCNGLNSLNYWGKTALDRLPSGSPILNDLQRAGLNHSDAWLRAI